MGQGAATTITPQGGRTPSGLPTHNLATCPPLPAPHYRTRHTEARSPVEVKWTNPRNKEKNREGWGDPKPKKAEGGEPRETLRY